MSKIGHILDRQAWNLRTSLKFWSGSKHYMFFCRDPLLSASSFRSLTRKRGESELSLKSSTKAVVAVRLANDPSLSSARVSVHRKEDEIFEIGGSVSVAQIEGHPIQLQLSLL